MTSTRKTTSKKTSAKTHSNKMKLLNDENKWGRQLKKISTNKSGNPVYLEKSIGMDIDYYINNNHIARVNNKTGNIHWYVNEKTLPSKAIYEILKDSRNRILERENAYLSAIKDIDNQIKKEASWCKKQGMNYEQTIRHLENSDYSRTLLDNKNVVNNRLNELYEIRNSITSNREKAIHTYPAKRRS